MLYRFILPSLLAMGLSLPAGAQTAPAPPAPPVLKKDKAIPSRTDDRKQSPMFVNEFEISVEWAKPPKPTLPNPSGPTEVAKAPANEPTAVWSLLSQDKTLYHSLSRWAQTANWQLMWEAERDFPINAQISVEGSFTVAIQMVMNSLANTDYPLQAVMNHSTRVISIIRHQDPYAR
jgi:hypothetical protein